MDVLSLPVEKGGRTEGEWEHATSPEKGKREQGKGRQGLKGNHTALSQVSSPCSDALSLQTVICGLNSSWLAPAAPSHEKGCSKL